MPEWNPNNNFEWRGGDIYIIGGGTSLKDFNWSLLKDKKTIGCNAAFLLGADICKICIFGDDKFYKTYQMELKRYKGIVVTNQTKLIPRAPNWLWYMARENTGLHFNALGWNANTGASAINLALLLQPKRIYLLGFDMKLSREGKNNWHNKGLDKPSTVICDRMKKNFKYVYKDWQSKFSQVEIFNITDDSDLDVFPKIGVKEFWNERLLK